jgi:hypothetical protein
LNESTAKDPEVVVVNAVISDFVGEMGAHCGFVND